MPSRGGQDADGRQVRWDKHNQARRQHILDAAIAVLEDAEPGGEVHVQQIADRAGLSRTVVYRHFADRADLDARRPGRSRSSCCGPSWSRRCRSTARPSRSSAGSSAPTSAGRPRTPRCTSSPQDDPPGQRSTQGPGQMERAIGHIAGQVEDLITSASRCSTSSSTSTSAEALDPLVFGLVGAVFTSVAAGCRARTARPSAEQFVDLVDRVDLAPDRGHGPGPRRGARPRHPGRAAARGGVRRRRRVTGPDARGVHVQPGVGEPDDLDRLWTPHRMAYIRGENKPADGSAGECPFCRIPALATRRGSSSTAASWATPCSTSTPTRRAT